MTNTPLTLHQNLFNKSHPSIALVSCPEASLTEAMVSQLLETASDSTIGMAPVYGANCSLVSLAFSTSSKVLLVQISSQKPSKKFEKRNRNNVPSKGRQLLQDKILCCPNLFKYAFQMDKVATALHLDIDLRINQAIDLLSTVKPNRQSLDALMLTLGGEQKLNRGNLVSLFKDEERRGTTPTATSLQAWAANYAGGLIAKSPQFAKIRYIDTGTIDEDRLALLAKTLRDADRLNALKPTRVKNDIDASFTHKQGNLHLTSTRFKTRLMSLSATQTIEIETSSQGKSTSVKGRTSRVTGRAATISLQGNFSGDKIKSITTVGRERLTNAEELRANIVLFALQGSITYSAFFYTIWFPDSNIPTTISAQHLSSPAPPLHFPGRTLNTSQKDAVGAILSNASNDRVTLIHGPPGTGKTTVIAAAITSITSANRMRTVWIIAQSNIAVKNVAEKLADVGFLDFKILVSKDFHYDWHEHLYEKINHNLIRSDDFNSDATAIDRLLLGSRVILCTLSMLSNGRLSTVARLAPIETVIIDEASQIEVGDYIPMLHRFQPTLKKLVFIGDNKQLAPYGQEDLGNLESIFEIPHLQSRAIFLDTQYRMPVPIGNFISQTMYDGKLKTVHSESRLLSCRFIDVAGKEIRSGNSWVNFKEARTVIDLARKYTATGKSFRIITPYDSQRSLLEERLKEAKLPWEDKCFNVDSFQGNEDDHIVISVVRTDKVGFLKERRRTNVMLTRCKKSMVICTSRAFLEGIASTSVVGEMALSFGRQCWIRSDTVQLFLRK